MRAGALHFPHGVDHLARVIASCASQHQRAAFGLLDGDLDDPLALGRRERRRFSRRAAGHEKVHACIDLPARELSHGCLVERSGLGEGRDECGADAGESCLITGVPPQDLAS